MAQRTLLRDFMLANPAYARATVTAFVSDAAGNPTAVKATLYAALTGSATVQNPFTLDSEGKNQQAVYFDTKINLTITGLSVNTHTTGAINPSVADSDIATLNGAIARGFFIVEQIRAFASRARTAATQAQTAAAQAQTQFNATVATLQTSIKSLRSSFLKRAANLSDLTAVTTARTNLGFPSSAAFPTIAAADWGRLMQVNEAGGALELVERLASFHNRIINGDMRLDQRQNGATYTFTGSLAVVYALDRWAASGQVADGVFTIARATATPPAGFTHYMRLTTTTADAAVGAAQIYQLLQRIEGSNIFDALLGTAGAKEITVSFYVRSSLTGTFGVALLNGANNRTYVGQYTINAANTWEKKTITLVGDTTGTWTQDNTTGLMLAFDLGAGSDFEAGAANVWGAGNFRRIAGNTRLIETLNATLDLTGVQVEVSPKATPIEKRSLGIELLLCQRYYEVLMEGNTNANWLPGQCFSATQVGVGFRWKVTKRATPVWLISNATHFSVTNSTGGSVAVTSTAGGTLSTIGARLDFVVAAGLTAGNASLAFGSNASAHLAADAEL